MPCFRDEDGPALTKLFNVLMTYAFFNFDLGMMPVCRCRHLLSDF
jgi:hypothetical protein